MGDYEWDEHELSTWIGDAALGSHLALSCVIDALVGMTDEDYRRTVHGLQDVLHQAYMAANKRESKEDRG